MIQQLILAEAVPHLPQPLLQDPIMRTQCPVYIEIRRHLVRAVQHEGGSLSGGGGISLRGKSKLCLDSRLRRPRRSREIARPAAPRGVSLLVAPRVV